MSTMLTVKAPTSNFEPAQITVCAAVALCACMHDTLHLFYMHVSRVSWEY
uniref:Uncharacterized protein n=1 Tax=Setaria italica TaxID=4555 RepID=K3ZPG9_SETIT